MSSGSELQYILDSLDGDLVVRDQCGLLSSGRRIGICEVPWMFFNNGGSLVVGFVNQPIDNWLMKYW